MWTLGYFQLLRRRSRARSRAINHNDTIETCRRGGRNAKSASSSSVIMLYAIIPSRHPLPLLLLIITAAVATMHLGAAQAPLVLPGEDGGPGGDLPGPGGTGIARPAGVTASGGLADGGAHRLPVCTMPSPTCCRLLALT